MASTTPSQQLADVLLGRPLADYVSEKRQAIPRWTWRLIAHQLSADTDSKVTVSGEALRQWFRDEVAA